MYTPSPTTLSATSANTPAQARSGLLARRPLIAFFILAFAGTWIVEIPLALSKQGLGLLPFNPSLDLLGLLVALSAFTGPMLAAFAVTGALEGKAGVGRLLRRFVQWRAGIHWYLLALFGMPLIMALAASVFLGATPISSLITHWRLLFTLYLPYTLTIGIILGGGLAEEPGWRGFALPHLQGRFGPLVGSLVLGALWGLWHLPLFLIPGLDGSADIMDTAMSYAGFMVAIVAFTLMVTWVYNNTAGSLLIIMALHSARNAVVLLERQLFPAFLQLPQRYWALAVVFAVCALLLLLVTRGTLSFKRSAASTPATLLEAALRA